MIEPEEEKALSVLLIYRIDLFNEGRIYQSIYSLEWIFKPSIDSIGFEERVGTIDILCLDIFS